LQVEKSIIFLKNVARHVMEGAFKAQNLARHEPECLIGCAAYDSFDGYIDFGKLDTVDHLCSAAKS
jgi:predicted ATP-dependent Lon-type protease